MVEKLSESDVRLGKITKLKKKIISDIDKLQTQIEASLRVYGWNEDDIITAYNLVKLRCFVEKEDFMGFIVSDENSGNIIYDIPIQNIDMWLDESSRFVASYLAHASRLGSIDFILNADYMGHSLISFTEQLIYETKKKGYADGKVFER